MRAQFTLPANVFHLEATRTTAQAEDAPVAAEQAPVPVAALAGLRGLVVEDNLIISLDAEQMMFDNGMVEVFTAGSVGEARKVIAAQAIDVALLDVNLGSETSFPLVRDLNARGIPFVFVTGYGEDIELPLEAGETDAVKKPFVGELLVSAIARAAARRRKPE